MNAPIIKLEIQSMKQSIMHAFTQQMMDISEEVQRALDRECTHENIQRIVNTAAKEAVEEAVSSAVKRWWAIDPVARELVNEAVASRLNEDANLYRSMAK